jgi:uncharacterized repeat protein (TIGR01451 family)
MLPMNIHSNRLMNKPVAWAIAFLFVLAGLNIAQTQVTLSGTIHLETDDPVSNVPVFLSGDLNLVTTTASDGTYSFEVTAGGSYTITPFADVDHLNGVSVVDLVLLQQHVFGAQLLDSPYRIIAADVNNSGTITLADTLGITNAIFGIDLEFPNNTSWRFVDAAYTFANPQNPWSQPFPEFINANGVNNDVADLDFVGIKVGDLNNTVVPNLLLEPCDITCGHISGNVFHDVDFSCTENAGEIGLQNWVITATSDTSSFHTTSNSFGNYSIPVFPDEYTLTISPPNGLWLPCENGQTVTVNESEVVSFDVAAQAATECPALEVNLGTPFLRPCFDGFYIIEYCNFGTAIAENVVIEVVFDPLIDITGSNPAWTSQNGNSFTYELGDLDVFECETINVQLFVDCEAELGQTLCSEAWITPDTLCAPVPDWDGSMLDVTGYCDGDSVRFEIINTGESMSEPVEFIVIEDDMIMMTDDDQVFLGSQQTKEIAFPANGSTWRLQADQASSYPFEGQVSASVEGCGVNGSNTFSLGFVNQFPWYTAAPTRDVDCVVTTAAFDPNDKQAIPTGVDEAHFIERGVDLEYRIRFQNTGTDTAFNVFILDTLSEHLDITSVRPLSSSHDYQFNILDDNVIEFRFPDIMLPDSNVNEPLSHGFVKFSVDQFPNLPLGTVINNSAAIYFDFNDPIITNVVFHTIGENFLDVINHTNTLKDVNSLQIKVFPNPMSNEATLSWEGRPLQNARFRLFNLQGQLLRKEPIQRNQLTILRGDLLPGIYFFEVYETGQRIGTGKLVVR